MNKEAEQLLGEANALLGRIEQLVNAGGADAPGQEGEASEPLRDRLGEARERVDALKRAAVDEFNHGVQATDRLVRDQPWLAIGIAAAAAFVLGIVVARRE